MRIEASPKWVQDTPLWWDKFWLWEERRWREETGDLLDRMEKGRSLFGASVEHHSGFLPFDPPSIRTTPREQIILRPRREQVSRKEKLDSAKREDHAKWVAWQIYTGQLKPDFASGKVPDWMTN